MRKEKSGEREREREGEGGKNNTKKLAKKG
jgi:hypothetical protein